MGFLDRLKNFGSKILTGIKSMSEKVIPVVREIAPYASQILKTIPVPGASVIGNVIDKYSDPVLRGAENVTKLIK